MAMVTAACLVPPCTARAGDDAPVSCRRAQTLVALAAGQAADSLVAGELCTTPDELSRGSTVQLLVHGATYSHEYWDLGTVHGATYSYAREVAALGTAAFAPDEIGVGGSSHPLSTLVTVDTAGYVTHQVVRALRDGSLTGTAFGKVIAVGHALGSVVVWDEAIRYGDVNGVVVTGAAHSRAARFEAAMRASFYPAVEDPRFRTTGLDSGYLTTRTEARAGLFCPAFIPEEERHKDVVPETELLTAQGLMVGTATRAIRVPVLAIIGSNDATTCGPNMQGGVFDCSSAAAVARQEAAYYAARARLHACVIPGAGHDLNLTSNHRLEVADVMSWTALFIDQRLAYRKSYSEHLPWNCAAVAPQLAAATAGSSRQSRDAME
jgi:pimeloyl-ACP methyl ester carboxylesterase